MTLEREEELRGIARREHGANNFTNGGTAILADFYEHHGQQSRAALWRQHEELMTLEATRAFPPDLLLKKSSLSPIDPRRNAMIWLLSGVAHAMTTDPHDIMGEIRFLGLLPRVFKLTAARLRTITKERDRMIWEAAVSECNRPTMRATQRLAAVGALPMPTPGVKSTVKWRVEPAERFLIDIELPPDTWPVTDRDVRRRRRMATGATS